MNASTLYTDPQKASQKASMRAALLFGRWWTITALIASLALLMTAHAFQKFGGLDPCHLCLKQRDIYWIAVVVSLIASVWALFTGAKGPPRVFAFVLFAIFATGAALALFHAGVELKWWPGPETCTGGGDDISIDSMAALLSGAPITIPQCDVIAWKMWGLSMAGWNAIISAILAVLSFIASLRLKYFFRRPKNLTK
ncbi:disulfide bond formation protein B [Asticcacaulis machinosus]|uniref:Disulfide bond formation protein B n=1 Tax=Asticcacaulis machinosus TaxID=2984211 RepID=A0ABT5HN70_9CAUL|nr:disulfide bond formation protein B [Asticcacaulis machinosus]MDC7677670.1 disulfide bond formation protein B [Asticcacaulis machinosus]